MSYRPLKIFLFLFCLIFLACKQQTDIINAPVSSNNIADFELVFTEDEYIVLSNTLDHIKTNYDIHIFFLSVSSYNGLEGDANYISKRINQIFTLSTEERMNKKVIFFLFSHKDRYNSLLTSKNFRNSIDKRAFDSSYDEIIAKYYPKHKYFEAFSKIFDLIEREVLKEQERKKGTKI